MGQGKGEPSADEVKLGDEIKRRINKLMADTKCSRGQAERQVLAELAKEKVEPTKVLAAWQAAKLSSDGFRLVMDWVDSDKVPGGDAARADDAPRKSRRQERRERREERRAAREAAPKGKGLELEMQVGDLVVFYREQFRGLLSVMRHALENPGDADALANALKVVSDLDDELAD